jgi:hypothetical protein
MRWIALAPSASTTSDHNLCCEPTAPDVAAGAPGAAHTVAPPTPVTSAFSTGIAAAGSFDMDVPTHEFEQQPHETHSMITRRMSLVQP